MSFMSKHINLLEMFSTHIKPFGFSCVYFMSNGNNSDGFMPNLLGTKNINYQGTTLFCKKNVCVSLKYHFIIPLKWFEKVNIL